MLAPVDSGSKPPKAEGSPLQREPQRAAGAERRSFLMWSAAERVAAATVLVAGLWAAVAWALSSI